MEQDSLELGFIVALRYVRCETELYVSSVSMYRFVLYASRYLAYVNYFFSIDLNIVSFGLVVLMHVAFACLLGMRPLCFACVPDGLCSLYVCNR